MSHKVLLFSPTLLWESSWPHLVVPYTEEPISQPFVGKNGFLFVLQKRMRMLDVFSRHQPLLYGKTTAKPLKAAYIYRRPYIQKAS